MPRNPYDDEAFFTAYSRMDRSVKGLEGAGEWHELKTMLPDFKDKLVLDLGCGFGWHCRYAMEQGARAVVGVDSSERMLRKARSLTPCEGITYKCMSIEDAEFPEEVFDVALSSLAFHYIASFDAVCRSVAQCLVRGGDFVFSVEHPVFTAEGSQEWIRDAAGNRLFWPVDRYFDESRRTARFLGEDVTKYHKTLTTYLNTLLQTGFELREIREPEPDPALLDRVPGMWDELRRPMMLLAAARKK